jgi:hypothetical protein
MSKSTGKLLFWSPRILSLCFIAFLSIFAMDVFGEHLGFWRSMLALAMHLIPSITLLAVLILAWRREWVGSLLYAAAALLYVGWAAFVHRPISLSMRFTWMLAIAGPAIVIAILFLLNWRKHDELRALLQ